MMKQIGLFAAATAAACVMLGAAVATRQDGSAGSAKEGWREVSERFGGAMAMGGTLPSRDVTMAFSFATEVREILVEGGERVEQGQLLARARDADVVAALEQQRIRSGSRVNIELAAKQEELARIRYDKITEVRAGGGSSEMEREERRVEWEAAVLQHQQAIMQYDEEQYRLKQLEGSYERYRMEAPFDGIVEEVMFEVGQTVRETDPGIRVVNTDVLALDVSASTDVTIGLGVESGDPAWVLMDIGGTPVMARGVVKYVSPVADSVSRTQRVRVEVENTGGWPAGMQARVRFDEPGEGFGVDS